MMSSNRRTRNNTDDVEILDYRRGDSQNADWWRNRILMNRTISNFLRRFPEECWLRVVKYTLIAGIQDVCDKHEHIDEDTLENHVLSRVTTGSGVSRDVGGGGGGGDESSRFARKITDETARVQAEIHHIREELTRLSSSMLPESRKQQQPGDTDKQLVVDQLYNNKKVRQKPSHAWRDGSTLPIKQVLSGPSKPSKPVVVVSRSVDNDEPTQQKAPQVIVEQRPQPRLAYSVKDRDDGDAHIVSAGYARRPQKKKRRSKTIRPSSVVSHSSAYMLKRPPFVVSTLNALEQREHKQRRFRHVKSRVKSRVQADKEKRKRRTKRHHESVRNMLAADDRVRALSASPKWEIYVPGKGKVSFGEDVQASTRVVTERDPLMNISDSFLNNPLYEHFSDRTPDVNVADNRSRAAPSTLSPPPTNISLKQQRLQTENSEHQHSLSLSSPSVHMFDTNDESVMIENYFPSTLQYEKVDADGVNDVENGSSVGNDENPSSSSDDSRVANEETNITLEDGDSTSTTNNTTTTAGASTVGAEGGDESFWVNFERRFPHLAKTSSFARYRDGTFNTPTSTTTSSNIDD